MVYFRGADICIRLIKTVRPCHRGPAWIWALWSKCRL